MQHLSTEELIGLSESGLPSENLAHHHLKACAPCSREYSEMESRRALLRSLPPCSPRADLWPSIRRTVRRRRALLATGKYGGLIAASALLGWWLVMPAWRDAFETPAPAELASESQELEHALNDLDASSVLRLGQAKDIALIESKIAEVDEQLAAIGGDGKRSEKVRLLQTRIELLRTLVQLHQSTVFVSL